MVNYADVGFDHLIAIEYENIYRIIKTVYDIFIKMPVSVNHKKRTYSLFFSYPFFIYNIRMYYFNTF